MKNDLIDAINRYTVKHNRKIQKTCEPLKLNLGIPFFTYYFIEEDGRFGTLSNNPQLLEYYYFKEMYLDNPYMSHPDLFRSGYIITPCCLNEKDQKDLSQKCQGDHLFLMLERTGKRVEGFIFYDDDLNVNETSRYIAHLDLLHKFCRYFKREVSALIGQLGADRFNIKSVRNEAFLEFDSRMPLSSKDRNIKKFLKSIYGISPQEERCLELFKQGHSAQSTAAIMGLSRRTVETYFNNIKDKLGLSSKWNLLGY